jgi:hypothetical protein
MSCCCRRPLTIEIPEPVNYCEWCDGDLDTCVGYDLYILGYEDKRPRNYHVGQCCLDKDALVDYMIDFQARWQYIPEAELSFHVTPKNVTLMFEEARRRHYDGDREGARDMFRQAWRTYKKLLPEDQALVEKP